MALPGGIAEEGEAIGVEAADGEWKPQMESAAVIALGPGIG